MKTTILAVPALALMSFFYLAADINGHWTGNINGQFDVAYDFKVEGQKLTGTTKGPEGNDIQLKDGWFKDDSLGFTLPIMEQQLKITGKAKSADQIVLYVKGGQMGDMSFTVKRSKSVL